MSDIFSKAKEAIEKAVVVLLEDVKEEWRQQNKVASGKAMRSAKAQTIAGFDSVTGVILVKKYMLYQDKGVKASRVKIGRGLITGLTRWIRYKMPSVPAKKRKHVAWAIAKTMQREGMPTKNARRYSPSGRVLNWSSHALGSAEPKIDVIVEELLSQGIDIEILNIIKSGA